MSATENRARMAAAARARGGRATRPADRSATRRSSGRRRAAAAAARARWRVGPRPPAPACRRRSRRRCRRDAARGRACSPGFSTSSVTLARARQRSHRLAVATALSGPPSTRPRGHRQPLAGPLPRVGADQREVGIDAGAAAERRDRLLREGVDRRDGHGVDVVERTLQASPASRRIRCGGDRFGQRVVDRSGCRAPLEDVLHPLPDAVPELLCGKPPERDHQELLHVDVAVCEQPDREARQRVRLARTRTGLDQGARTERSQRVERGRRAHEIASVVASNRPQMAAASASSRPGQSPSPSSPPSASRSGSDHPS